MCCNVSSLNSFQELVIGEKSLDGTPENNLFIPGKDKEGFILTRLQEEMDILLQGRMIMVRKKAFYEENRKQNFRSYSFFLLFPYFKRHLFGKIFSPGGWRKWVLGVPVTTLPIVER